MTTGCPSCKSSLQGSPIPEEHRLAGLYGDDPPTHYSRKVGIEYPGIYDGVLVWSCPDCGYKWPRFAVGALYGAGIRAIEGETEHEDLGGDYLGPNGSTR